MSIRRKPDRPGSGGVVPRSAEELEGYLAGMTHRLSQLTVPADTRRAVAELLEQARRELAAGDLPGTERTTREAERQLDEVDEEEAELSEFPRGLVGYVPTGSRGSPTPREEEPLSNRMLLVHRLWEVRRAQRREVDPLLPALREAEAAYAAGDRTRARRLIDRVHADLEALGEPGGSHRGEV